MNGTKIYIACVVMVCLASCSPMSKESYLKRYNTFISDVSRNYKSYDDRAWKLQTQRFDQFSGKWYNKFKDQLTLKDQIAIKSNQTKWHYYRSLSEASSTIKQVLDAIDVKGMKNEIQYYIENNLKSDLQKFYEDAQKAGKDAQEAVEEILKELKVEIEELQK